MIEPSSSEVDFQTSNEHTNRCPGCPLQMTSTNINIGFGEKKNSSRVLKPPGGGHADIFGIRGDNDVQTPARKKYHPSTTINSCFIQDEVTKPIEEEPKNGDLENGNQNGNIKTDEIDENTEPTKHEAEKPKEEENKNPTPPRRVRVPPGGFSSGLW
ncbi:hypothetical protein NQ317_017516 [Molorchus minor]|uniref:Microtubule-associated protein Jupiter n=1 Tax=Molorchus minor TaxID=1323400 RepID=A0ABQ9JNS0_9CUCU|nr:hypothetical protein NQ317_017516 [Molorchus minor]